MNSVHNQVHPAEGLSVASCDQIPSWICDIIQTSGCPGSPCSRPSHRSSTNQSCTLYRSCAYSLLESMQCRLAMWSKGFLPVYTTTLQNKFLSTRGPWSKSLTWIGVSECNKIINQFAILLVE